MSVVSRLLMKRPGARSSRPGPDNSEGSCHETPYLTQPHPVDTGPVLLARRRRHGRHGLRITSIFQIAPNRAN